MFNNGLIHGKKIKSLIYSVYVGINLHITKIFMLPHHPAGYRDQTKQPIACYFVSAVTIHWPSVTSERTHKKNSELIGKW